tara:strand:+ start:118 stop:441 length:324 start_codon:yes stop_codon:yes gene_type:complete
MDFVGIIDSVVRVIFGYAIMFLIIILLSLPFIYSVVLFERIKNRFNNRFYPEDSLDLPTHIFDVNDERDQILNIREEIDTQQGQIQVLDRSNHVLAERLERLWRRRN